MPDLYYSIPAQKRKEIELLTEAIKQDMVSLTFCVMRIGERLETIRNVLTNSPHFSFRAWCKRVNIDYQIARRYSQVYRNAKRMLPEGALLYCLEYGIDLTGFSKDQPFGVFTKAVEIVGKPKPDDGAAWVDQVIKVNRSITGHIHSAAMVRRNSEAVDATEIKPDVDALVEHAVNVLLDLAQDLRAKQWKIFIAKVIKRASERLGTTEAAREYETEKRSYAHIYS